MNLLHPFVPERHFLEVPLPPKPATSNLISHKLSLSHTHTLSLAGDECVDATVREWMAADTLSSGFEPLNPQPYTLHPTPYTLLHPTPYTLHPT